MCVQSDQDTSRGSIDNSSFVSVVRVCYFLMSLVHALPFARCAFLQNNQDTSMETIDATNPGMGM